MTTATYPTTDLTKDRPDFFAADHGAHLVHLPSARYLTLDGGGAASYKDGLYPDFQASVKALYAVVNKIKEHCMKAGRDFKVTPMEAQWCAYHHFGERDRDMLNVDPASWCWKVMIMLPDYVDAADVATAKAAMSDVEGVQGVQLKVIDEGLCVQALHAGPYETEHRTLVTMRKLIEREHLRPCGLHHEVYLNNPTHTLPEDVRVILRQPVRAIDEEVFDADDEW